MAASKRSTTEFKRSDFVEPFETIGKGGYGTVYKTAFKQNNNQIVAIKEIKEFDPEILNKKKGDVLLSELKHKNIVEYFGHFIENVSDEQSTSIYFVMKYYKNGNLGKEIKLKKQSKSQFEENRILKWSKELLQATHYLNYQKICHSDIKPENILIDDQNESILLSDFGSAYVLRDCTYSTIAITFLYSAPERLGDDNVPSPESDLWSCGIVIYELIHLKRPFKNTSEITNKSNLNLNGSGLSKRLESFFKKIFSKEPNGRGSILHWIAHLDDIENGKINTKPNVERIDSAASLSASSPQIITTHCYDEEETRRIIESIENDMKDYENETNEEKRKIMAFEIEKKANDLIEKLDANNLEITRADHLIMSVAIFYQDKLNQYEKALEYKLKANEMRKRLFGENRDHKDVASSLNGLGVSNERLNQYQKALEYHLKSYEMQKRLFGENTDHEDVAQSLHNLGVSYERLNQYEKAHEYHLKAYEMRMRLFGENSGDEDVADSLFNLGVSYDNLNQHEKAHEYKLKAYEMRKKLFDENSNYLLKHESFNLNEITFKTKRSEKM